MSYIKGIDISSVQGKVDFKSLIPLDIKFVIVKCYEGNSGKDPLYDSNIAAAKAAGLKVMAYHFGYPLPTTPGHADRDPIAQARVHFKAANGELAAFDLEWPAPNEWAKWGCTAAQINQWALAYLEEYSRLDGRKMIVYTYPDFAKNVKLDPKFAEYKLWIASYQSTPYIPSPWTDWDLWQTSGGSEKLPNGVPVDMDLAKDLSLWDSSPPEIVLEPVTPEPSPEVPIDNSPKEDPKPEPSANVPSLSLLTVLLNLLKKVFKF